MNTTLLQWTCGVPGKGFLNAYVIQPFYNLTNMENLMGLIIAWSIVIGLWIGLYYSAPCTILNCKDGFIDANTVTISSIALYWAASVVVIMVLRSYYCQQRKRLVQAWRMKTAKPPRWLSDEIYSDESDY
jgi:hypothetical protein